MLAYGLLFTASAFAADIISYKPNPSVNDLSLKNEFTFTPSKAGIVYFEAPLGLKLSQCAVSVKESDVGTPVTIAVGGVPVFDGTPSANAVIKSMFYEKNTCTPHNSSISISRTIGKATICKSTGDPHYLSSFGSKFSFQDEGYFTLFNSNHLTVQVFQKKFGKVSYNQAAAIRYGNEVYILDVRSYNPKTALSRANGRQKYVIYTAPTAKQPTHKFTFSPCSSTITIKVNTGKIGQYLDITINAAASYSQGTISGICGAKTAPKDLVPFVISNSQNYFLNRYETLSELSDADYKRLVNCVIPPPKDACNPPVTLTTTQVVTLPTYVLPTSSSVLPVLSSSTSSPVSTPTSVPPNYNETVVTLCTKVMVAIKCGDLVDIDYYTQACISDCHGTGSLAPIESTKLQMIVDCQSRTELRRCHPDPIKAQTAVTIQVSLGISDNKCPNSCSKNGQCISTGCVCNTGYTGLGCETSLKEIAAPVSEFYSPIVYPSYAPVYGYTQILGQAPPSTNVPSIPNSPVIPVEAVAPVIPVEVVASVIPVGAVASVLGEANKPTIQAVAPVSETTLETNNASPAQVEAVAPVSGETAEGQQPSEGIYSPASPVYTTTATFVSIMLLIVNLF